MTWREIREADLMECLSIEPRHLGDEIVDRERAVAAWKWLIRSRSFNSCVIESAKHPGRILGFGASVFVSADFATSEVEEPRPGMNSRLIANIANGASAVRAEADLYDTDAGDPLDTVTLYGSWVSGLSDEDVGEIQMALPVSFIECHTGYRLHRLLQEAIGITQCGYLESSGVWRVVARYRDGDNHLAVMTRSDALAVSGSVAASLFRYEPPVLGLRDGEKHLLSEAMTQRSDSELAARMIVSPSTIKKRWQALFERIADVYPKLFDRVNDQAANGSRGPQKRHHILAFVRSHPQELRPYRWRAFKET